MIKSHFYLFFCFFISTYASAQGPDTLRRRWNIDSIAVSKGWDTSSQRTVTDEEVGKLLSILNKSYLMLNRVNSTSGLKLNIDEIELNNSKVFLNLEGLKGNLTDRKRILTIRTLQMYNILIGEMLTELEGWQETLNDQEDAMEKMQEAMIKVRRDSNLIALLSNKNLRTQYRGKLREIRKKWKAADSTNRARLNRIRSVKNKVSENYITATEAQENVSRQLSVVMLKMFYKEDSYLWEKPKREDEQIYRSSRTYEAEKNAMGYYFSKQYKTRILMGLSALLFFLWVFNNIRYLQKNGLERIIAELRFVQPIPITATLIVVLTMFPFFDLHSPAVFVELMQFLLLIVLSFIFWQRWPRKMFYSWLGIFLFYLLFAFSRGIVTLSWLERILYIGLNAGATLFVTSFLRNMRNRVHVLPFLYPILIFSITMNVASALFNMLGRMTLAKGLGTASITGVTQIIALAVFTRILTEAFYLQVQKSRKQSNFKTPIGFDQVAPLFNKILSAVVILLWLIFFTVNLNVFDPVYEWVMNFLNSKRSLGSITFTFGNLVTFGLVLYLSFILQKLTAYFMGIVDNDNIIAENIGKKGNRLLFARLIIIIAGFLFAVTASSLPVDRLTIVFSALGVGIGLGLQSIVSNFVSGIILLFERPFQIGDTIEIGNKSGRVKTISVRSSIIQTDVGSEIIIPNGDLLSQQVTNWTLSNRYVQRDLKIFLEGKSDFSKAKALIQQALRDNKYIIQSRENGVLIEEINTTFIKVIVQFWLTDISDSEEVKSDLKQAIFNLFQTNGIEQRPPV